MFRDRDLSDGFGFLYHKTTADTAGDDVLRRIKQIALDTPQDEVLLPIILDGENPWEHYHEGGEEFLSHLYRTLSESSLDGGDSFRVTTATFSEADGRTTLTILVQAPSKVARDAIVESGMEDGLQDALDLLEEIAAALD